MMDHFEILIRSILIRPDKFAVLLLGQFSPQTHQTHGFAGPDHWHNIVAQFYDVLHVSVKSALFPDYMRDAKSIQKYFVDPVLASRQGISEILVAYLQSQICTAWCVATGSSYEAVPVHTADSEAGTGDAHGLFGGIGQQPGVPEPEKDLAVDAAVEKKLAAAAMKDRGDCSSPQLLTVPSGPTPDQTGTCHLKRSQHSAFLPTTSSIPCHCCCSTARAGTRTIRVGAGAMR